MSQPAHKRRKVPRKGTHSCWECRRRKVKCLFRNPDDPTCIKCIERESACISQRLSVDDAISQASSGQIDTVSSGNAYCPPVSPRDLLDCSAATHAHDIAAAANGAEGVITPEQSPQSGLHGASSAEANFDHPYFAAHQKSAHERHGQISQRLYALLPPSDLRSLLAHESPGASLVLAFAHSRDDQIAGRVLPNWSLASSSWPSPNTHPVLIAKRLLQYAICLQSLPPSFDATRLKTTPEEKACELAGRWVGAVTSLVSNDDELVSFAEGIETLALLSMFQADAGHMRRAWTTVRRGLNFCQLMGIDKPSTRQLVRSCASSKDPATRPSLPVLWLRLNCSDRYHSLILGLPVGSHKDTFARVDVVPCGGPLDRLDMEHAVICRKIADRNDLLPGSPEAHSLTQSIHDDLERASGILDDHWWAIPASSSGTAWDTVSPTGSPAHFLAARSAIKLQVQHFTLLILLHLPYLLQKNEGQRHVASQEACIHASRAVLERFLAYRKNNAMIISGRHIDYSALIAGMTLPLGYLEKSLENSSAMASDRVLLERAILIFRDMTSCKNDRLAVESADTLHQLLPIMADAPQGRGQEPLRLKVPFLGTVTIQNRPLGLNSAAQIPQLEAGTAGFSLDDFDFDPQLSLTLDSEPLGMESSELFGVGTADQSFLTPASSNVDFENGVFQGIDKVYWSMLDQAVNGVAETQGDSVSGS
ncbi:hypothetical protein AUP68_04350 [Ilyonectria robusta]